MTLRGISMGAMCPGWSEIFEYFAIAVWLNSGLFPGFAISDPALCSSSEATARYFIEKQPILVSPATGSGGPPVVTFTFIDEGLHSTSGFESFLQNYRALISTPRWRCIVWQSAPMFEPAAWQRASSLVVESGVFGERSSSLIRWWPRS